MKTTHHIYWINILYKCFLCERHNNNNFKFVKSGRRGINELAYYLTNGNLSYPMTVFLDENYNLITLLPGYHKPDFYKKVLSYIGNDFWKNMTWEEYLKNN